MLTRFLRSLRSLLIQYKLITSFLIRKELKEMIYASLMLGLILYNNTNYFLLERKISKKLTYNKHITLAPLASYIYYINTLASLRSAYDLQNYLRSLRSLILMRSITHYKNNIWSIKYIVCHRKIYTYTKTLFSL